jgi:aminoglycoside phosphotransferase (APT) family kinase protein
MRQDWIRSEPEIRLDRQTVAKLVAPAFPTAEVIACEPARGGLANTTINVQLAAPPWHISLRLSQRDPSVLGKEEALNKLLLAHHVPTARFLYTAATNEITHSPYALLEWVQGEGLDRAILTLGREGEAQIGCEIGAMFAKLHAITFDRHGYLDSALRIRAPIDLSSEGLLAFLRQNLKEGLLAERLGPLRAGLLSFIQSEGPRLDPWLVRPSLVHADFNGSNVLIRQEEGAWRLAGVIDWEFALSATPALDFGNLLRAPLGERSILVDAVAASYRDHGGYLPKDWRRLARIADLYAWIDVLNQPDSAQGAIEDGLAIIAETIQGVG